jgi:hypothetical protein
MAVAWDAAIEFVPDNYGPVFGPLLKAAPLNELGPGRPDPAVRKALQKVTLDPAFAPQKVGDRDMAEACLAGLWLMHDFLEESHAISQRIRTPTGSYWHGIMHRREPDYGNAEYWFRRVGNHPVFEPLAAAARERAAAISSLEPAASFLLEQPAWQPYRFIDLCSTAIGSGGELELLCRRIQRHECELLFDYCYRSALQP